MLRAGRTTRGAAGQLSRVLAAAGPAVRSGGLWRDAQAARSFSALSRSTWDEDRYQREVRRMGRDQMAVQMRWKSDGGDGFFKIFIEKLKKNIEQSPELGTGLKSISDATEKPREAAKKAAEGIKSTTSLSTGMLVTGLSRARAMTSRYASAAGQQLKKAKDWAVDTASKNEAVKQTTDAVKGAATAVKSTTSTAYKATKDVVKEGAKVAAPVLDPVKKGAQAVGSTVSQAMPDLADQKPDRPDRKRDPFAKKEKRPEVTETGIQIKEQTQWERMRDSTVDPLSRKLGDIKDRMEDSNNPMIQRAMDGFDGVQSMISKMSNSPQETAVMQAVYMADPSFEMDVLLETLRTSTIPLAFDAVNTGDLDMINEYCGELMRKRFELEKKELAKHGLKRTVEILQVSPLDVMKMDVESYGTPGIVLKADNVQTRTVIDRTKQNAAERQKREKLKSAAAAKAKEADKKEEPLEELPPDEEIVFENALLLVAVKFDPENQRWVLSEFLKENVTPLAF